MMMKKFRDKIKHRGEDPVARRAREAGLYGRCGGCKGTGVKNGVPHKACDATGYISLK